MTKFIKVKEGTCTYLLNIDDISFIGDTYPMTVITMKSRSGNDSGLFFKIDEKFEEFCVRLTDALKYE